MDAGRGVVGWAVALALAPLPAGAETFGLRQLEDMAAGHPALKAAAQGVEAARGGVQGARAFPNPEVEYLAGSMRYRPGIQGTSGGSASVSVSQPLDLPFRRIPRIEAAKAGLAASKADFRAFSTDWIAAVRLAYFDVLRRMAEKANAQQDLLLMQSLHGKIALQVKEGDAPRIELIRAEADLLNVQKAAQAADLREEQARLQLREVVGPGLPADFSLAGQIDAALPLASPGALEEQAMAANPALEGARARAEQARHRLHYEEGQRLPAVALRATREADREMSQVRVGVSLTIPLWDRRLGPVREAEAEAARTTYAVDSETYTIRQRLQIALRQYDVAQSQVQALENGVVSAAQAAVNVAQAAYRAGERGLIDVLDAQRVYRAARADLIDSRYQLAAAWVDIQRLVTSPEAAP